MSWQPISTAPKGWGAPEILAWVPLSVPGHGAFTLIRWDEEKQDWLDYESLHAGVYQPTHWMPLPAPPTDDAPETRDVAAN